MVDFVVAVAVAACLMVVKQEDIAVDHLCVCSKVTSFKNLSLQGVQTWVFIMTLGQVTYA